MQLGKDFLYVVERRDLRPGDENLVRIDLRTESADRTFKDFYRNNLSQ